LELEGKQQQDVKKEVKAQTAQLLIRLDLDPWTCFVPKVVVLVHIGKMQVM